MSKWIRIRRVENGWLLDLDGYQQVCADENGTSNFDVIIVDPNNASKKFNITIESEK